MTTSATLPPLSFSLPTMSSLDTVFPADSVEFCPHPSFADIFACGTYQLEQPDSLPPSPDELDEEVAHPVVPRKQQRKGECLLLRAQTSENGEQLCVPSPVPGTSPSSALPIQYAIAQDFASGNTRYEMVRQCRTKCIHRLLELIYIQVPSGVVH